MAKNVAIKVDPPEPITKVKSPAKARTAGKSLVIVESPAKARTVGQFLGRNYAVMASLGHVRDLPRKVLGVEVDNEFTPVYEVTNRKVIQEVKREAKNADHIYLATDPDREGEAISWHLVTAANLKPNSVQRVVFHEITKEAIEAAFKHPREIDLDLVDAQQARRVLDRLVGYRLSPLLWRKVGSRNLSAGRVQSVALRLVVEREEEIKRFIPQEYWSIEVTLQKSDRSSAPFTAILHSQKGTKQRITIPNQFAANELRTVIEGAAYQVNEVKKREIKGRPAPPFITSTLQQEASRKLRFTAKKTMVIAQQLYEGINVGSEGSVGLITYMRTDSTNLSASAIQETRDYIQQNYGAEYVPSKARAYTKKAKGAQEAHEAIRPTSVQRQPARLQEFLSSEQLKLYDLIWRRMVACQMADSLSDSTTVVVEATPQQATTPYLFHASGSLLRFDGFRTIYIESRDESGDGGTASTLPLLKTGEQLHCDNLEEKQHFTQPPPPYTEASLVKSLEERGIGRPSTYAQIISNIQDREYVYKERSHFHPTTLGEIVNSLLVEHFPNIVDPDFTARLEGELDDIAQGDRKWIPVLREFYDPFEQALEAAQSIPKISVPSGESCDQCERPMLIKFGRFGKFLACSGFPECRNAKSILVRIGVDCPRCSSDLVQRKGKAKGKRNRIFYGCSSYPDCDFVVTGRPLPTPCPLCSEMLVAYGRTNARCTSCEFKGPVEDNETELAEV